MDVPAREREEDTMSSPVAIPMALGLGAPEIAIILVILVLLFGAKKLPELARGSGRALRIFKAETKGLVDDDDDQKTTEQKQIDAQRSASEAQPLQTPQAEQNRSDDDR
jgi:sec-independent protein translocase protein TatA